MKNTILALGTLMMMAPAISFAKVQCSTANSYVNAWASTNGGCGSNHTATNSSTGVVTSSVCCTSGCAVFTYTPSGGGSYSCSANITQPD